MRAVRPQSRQGRQEWCTVPKPELILLSVHENMMLQEDTLNLTRGFEFSSLKIPACTPKALSHGWGTTAALHILHKV